MLGSSRNGGELESRGKRGVCKICDFIYVIYMVFNISHVHIYTHMWLRYIYIFEKYFWEPVGRAYDHQFSGSQFSYL